MNSKTLWALFLLFFIIASCKKQDSPNLPSFVGGSEGLDIKILQGAPPPVIQDEGSSPFSVTASIANVGEAEIGPGTENPFVLVRLLGIVPEQFGTKPEKLYQTLQHKLAGAKRNFDGTILPGEIEVATFEPLNFLGNVIETNEITMRLDVCYDYATYSTVKICLKDDILESSQDSSLCNLRDLHLPLGNSGAPLQIISADQSPAGNDRIQVNLVVGHVGRGMHFRRGTTDPRNACEFSQQNKDAYYTTMLVKYQDPHFLLSCQGLTQTTPDGYLFGEIRLYDNAPMTMTCYLKRTEPSKNRVYQSILETKLKYRYGEYVEIPIAVQTVQ